MDDILKYGEGHTLPIDPTIVQQMAPSTIKTIVEAIVELVTNSDDSYCDLEDAGIRPSGAIDIHVIRAKGGQCKFLAVIDQASGMDKDKLDEAIVFATKTSSFHWGRRRRGLLGRGMKEAIVALGRGEILTVKNGDMSGAALWCDEKEGPKTDSTCEPATDALRKKAGLGPGNGTAVRIEVSKKVSCPELEGLKKQIENHYALNDILSSKRRTVRLIFERDMTRARPGKATKDVRILRYSPPPGRLVKEKSFQVTGYGDEAVIRIFESTELLDSPRHNPCARAGLRVKSDGAILDNTLFNQTDQAASYFYGELVCDGIAKRIRDGDYGLINQNRGGVDWNHSFCRALAADAERLLETEVLRKKRELSVAQRGSASDKVKQRLDTVCHILNRLAREELEDDIEEMFDDRLARGDIETLEIVPSVAIVPYQGTRVLSVYAPVAIVKDNIRNPIVRVSTDNTRVPLLRQDADGKSPVEELEIVLHPHPKYPKKYYYSWFEVRGDLDGQSANIECSHGELIGKGATVTVGAQRKVGKRKTKAPRKGGMFTAIRPDAEPSPYQRVAYDEKTGTIWVYVKFPGMADYLGEDLSRIDTPEGSMLCAELVLECFCRVMAEKNFRRGRASVPMTDSPESAPYAVFTEVQRLQQKYAAGIYEALVVRANQKT